MSESDYQRLYGVIKVIHYMIGIISKNRQKDLKEDLMKLLGKYHQVLEVQKTIEIPILRYCMFLRTTITLQNDEQESFYDICHSFLVESHGTFNNVGYCCE